MSPQREIVGKISRTTAMRFKDQGAFERGMLPARACPSKARPAPWRAVRARAYQKFAWRANTSPIGGNGNGNDPIFRMLLPDEIKADSSARLWSGAKTDMLAIADFTSGVIRLASSSSWPPCTISEGAETTRTFHKCGSCHDSCADRFVGESAGIAEVGKED